LLALLLAGCDRGPGRTLAASAYERACESGRDCIPIFEGHIASCQAMTECPNAAIGKSAARAVDAKDYAQTCETVDDCVPVYVGPLGCCDHGCANAVISTAAMSQYDSDVAHRTPACFPRSPCEPVGPCTDGPRVDCQNNHCVLLTLTE